MLKHSAHAHCHESHSFISKCARGSSGILVTVLVITGGPAFPMFSSVNGLSRSSVLCLLEPLPHIAQPKEERHSFDWLTDYSFCLVNLLYLNRWYLAVYCAPNMRLRNGRGIARWLADAREAALTRFHRNETAGTYKRIQNTLHASKTYTVSQHVSSLIGVCTGFPQIRLCHWFCLIMSMNTIRSLILVKVWSSIVSPCNLERKVNIYFLETIHFLIELMAPKIVFKRETSCFVGLDRAYHTETCVFFGPLNDYIPTPDSP